MTRADFGHVNPSISEDRRSTLSAKGKGNPSAKEGEGGEVRLRRNAFVHFLLKDCPWLDRWQVFGGHKEGEQVYTKVRLWPSEPSGAQGAQTPKLDQVQPVPRPGGALVLIEDPLVSPRRSVSWEEFSLWYRDNFLDVKKGFTQYDYMENGEIERKTFRGFLAAVSDMSKSEIDNAIEVMDADRGGTIDYDEFLDW